MASSFTSDYVRIATAPGRTSRGYTRSRGQNGQGGVRASVREGSSWRVTILSIWSVTSSHRRSSPDIPEQSADHHTPGADGEQIAVSLRPPVHDRVQLGRIAVYRFLHDGDTVLDGQERRAFVPDLGGTCLVDRSYSSSNRSLFSSRVYPFSVPTSLVSISLMLSNFKTSFGRVRRGNQDTRHLR